VTVTKAPRLVVLGANGFIGHAVVREALARGLAVTALCTGDAWRLDGTEAACVDVRDSWWTPRFGDDLRRLLDGASALVVLAYGPPPESATAAERAHHEAAVNAAGVRVASAAAAAEGTRIIFSSSASVYGFWRDDPLDESAPPRPATPYARAKLDAEAVVADAGTPSTSLRLATVYGPGEIGHRAIPRFVTSLFRDGTISIDGDGSDVHDYVSVFDVGRAAVAAASVPSLPQLVNIGSGVGRTTNEVAATVAEAVGIPPVIRRTSNPRPPSRIVLDVSLARQSLGLEPQTDFTAAIRHEAAWVRDRLARESEPGLAAGLRSHSDS
jgi:UDP-glucose 4-epimerase